MAEPRLVLLDEPTAGVNPTLQNEIGERLLELPRRGITVLLIEHDMGFIARLCDPVIVMAEGQVLTQGTFDEVRADHRRAGGLSRAASGMRRGMSLLEIAGLRGGYAAADEIVKGADLAVAAGEIVALIGPNGAGKSTLLKLVAGLLRAERRQRALQGARDRRPGRRPTISRAGLSFVPQERNVFGTMSVRREPRDGRLSSTARTPGSGWPSSSSAFPCWPTSGARAARTLSGGQRQILAMAMALMNAPDLLLLDEPTAGLSPRAAEELFGTILALNRIGRGDPDGRAERAGGAGRRRRAPTCWCRAGRARGTGRPTWPPIRRIRDLFLGGKAAPMLKARTRERGTSHDNDPHRPPRRAGAAVSAALASPAVLRAQTDPIKLGTLTPLTGAGGPYGPAMAKAAAVGRRGGQRGGRRAGPPGSCW